MMTINSTLDNETASMIAREFGADVKMQTFEEELLQVEAEDIDPEDVVTRAPVVTVMGHVDHGKTTLLDAIRETRVAEREAGGITQHIGAYCGAGQRPQRRVPRHAGPRSVHDDARPRRPGHRRRRPGRRGRRRRHAADARSDRSRARRPNVPILVAINKIDKPNANPDRVKKELSDLGLVPEDWGGTTVTVPVSAKKRENISSAARDDPARHRAERAQGEPEAQRVGHRARSEARQGARPGRDHPRAGRHAARRRHAHRRHHRRQGARAHRRPRQADQGGGAGDAGRSARPRRPAVAGRRVPGARPTPPRRGRSRTTARRRRRTRRSAPRARG